MVVRAKPIQILLAAMFGAALLLASFPTSAEPASGTTSGGMPVDTDWSVTRAADTGPIMVRRAGAVSADLRLVGDEYNMFTPTLELKIAGCNGGGWSTSDSISPVGKTSAERAARVRDILVQQFEKAPQPCRVEGGVEAQILDGFEAAYARFEALK